MLDQPPTVLAALNINHLNTGGQLLLTNALKNFNLVANSSEDLRAAEVSVKHHFELADDSPIYFRPRRLPPLLDNVVEEEISRMLAGGIITPATSA